VEAILSACPTCTLTLKHQYPKIIDTPETFKDRVVDANAFLADRLDLKTSYAGSVAYHDPCHLRQGLGIHAEPRRLIGATGAELRPLPGGGGCCGFGGVAGFSHYGLSRRVGARRRGEVMDSGVDTLLTACPGCKMQFEDSLKRDPDYRVLHTVEFLREAAVAAGAFECTRGALRSERTLVPGR